MGLVFDTISQREMVSNTGFLQRRQTSYPSSENTGVAHFFLEKHQKKMSDTKQSHAACPKGNISWKQGYVPSFS